MDNKELEITRHMSNEEFEKYQIEKAMKFATDSIVNNVLSLDILLQSQGKYSSEILNKALEKLCNSPGVIDGEWLISQGMKILSEMQNEYIAFNVLEDLFNHYNEHYKNKINKKEDIGGNVNV